MRRERRPVIGDWWAHVAPAVNDACPQRNKESQNRSKPPLQAARRAETEASAHEKSQVEAARVDEEALQDVRVASQMRAPHATGLIEMGMGSFQSLAASPLQRHPSPAADTPPVRVDRGARRLLRPPAMAAIRFGDVGPQVKRGQIDEHLLA